MKSNQKRKNPMAVAELEATNEAVTITQESEIANEFDDSLEIEEFVTGGL